MGMELSFLRHGKSIHPMGAVLPGDEFLLVPRLIGVDEFQLVIPGWVALQQSPLALHQLDSTLPCLGPRGQTSECKTSTIGSTCCLSPQRLPNVQPLTGKARDWQRRKGAECRATILAASHRGYFFLLTFPFIESPDCQSTHKATQGRKPFKTTNQPAKSSSVSMSQFKPNSQKPGRKAHRS